MREGFSGYPEWRPDFESRLTVSLDVETYSWPNEEVMKTDPSGRRRVVIEGEAALVEAIYAAARPAIYAAINEAGDS